MLMKLSQLLRYQLYDCSRQKVLLSSEIAFLTNYLTLEQGSSARLNYELTSEGEVNRMLVPPLLFIPFVQYVVKLLHERQLSASVSLKIHLQAERGTVIFTCICPELDLSAGKGLERIRQRLNLLYGNRYELLLTTKCIRLELKGVKHDNQFFSAKSSLQDTQASPVAIGCPADYNQCILVRAFANRLFWKRLAGCLVYFCLWTR